MKQLEFDPLLDKTGFSMKIRAYFNVFDEMNYQFK
jgi:hypothetical protein